MKERKNTQHNRKRNGTERAWIAFTALSSLALTSPGCSTFRSIFAADAAKSRQTPIGNPFVDYVQNSDNKENIILRTKKGDRSLEIELPGSNAAMTDFVIPMSPSFGDSSGRGLASSSSAHSDPENDQSFRESKPSLTDREITSQFPTITPGQEGDQREVEVGLGLNVTDDETPAADRSYLASMDHIKQLFKFGRNEAGLLEIDEMLHAYPTDPKLYQMRGTLLDRVGRSDMALKSWNQALRLEPGNQALRRFIERKQKARDLASH